MNLGVLFRDEFEGFARSKAMLALWIGLPALVILLRLIRPDQAQMPLFLFTGILIGTIGGTLSAVMISTSITTDRLNGAFDLFLIRPVRRSTLILAKYLATISVLLIASALALGIGIVTDITAGYPVGSLVEAALDPLLLSLSGMAIACAAGVLLGILMNSVMASAIVSVYLGNQLSAVALLPALLLPQANTTLIALGLGVGVPALLLLLAIRVFARKSV